MFKFSNNSLLKRLFSSNGKKESILIGYSFSEIGRKDNQEDYVYPDVLDTEVVSAYYILCDGLGGHDSGEVASKAIATKLGEYFQLIVPQGKGEEIHLEDEFSKAMDFAYDHLDGLDTYSKAKMGTTMTAVFVNDGKYIAGHIGDSRIYQLRPSLYREGHSSDAIIFRTEDDSLVNKQLKAGEITEEEAKVFPRKNVITKAVMPHLEKRIYPTFHLSEDLVDGDYFFLCSDGILEQLDENGLCEIVTRSCSDKEKLEAIRQTCLGKTRDNFTCWLIHYQTQP